MPNLQLFHSDCLAQIPALEERSINMIYLDLPEEKGLWNKNLPLNQYVTINGLHYEHDNFMKLMYTKGFKYASALRIWNEESVYGFWTLIRWALALSGVVVILSEPEIAAKIEREATIPHQFSLQWMPENSSSGKIVSVFSPLMSRKREGMSEYFQCLPYLESDNGNYTIYNPKENLELLRKVFHYKATTDSSSLNPHPDTQMCQFLIESFSAPNDTILDLCMRSGTFGQSVLSLGRNFIGIEKDMARFSYAQKILSTESKIQT